MKPTEAIAGINIGVLTGYGVYHVASLQAHPVLTWVLVIWCGLIGTAWGALLSMWLDELIGDER